VENCLPLLSLHINLLRTSLGISMFGCLVLRSYSVTFSVKECHVKFKVVLLKQKFSDLHNSSSSVNLKDRLFGIRSGTAVTQ